MNTGCPFSLPKVANGIMCPDLKPLTILRTPLEIVVGNRGQTCSSVDQKVEVLESEEEKLFKLITLIQEWYEKGSILIFVEQ